MGIREISLNVVVGDWRTNWILLMDATQVSGGRKADGKNDVSSCITVVPQQPCAGLSMCSTICA